MKLIVGLGNPGPEYELTPHNMGFLAVDLIAEQHRALVNNRRGRALTGKVKIGGEEVMLAKPETYMNLSGMAVKELVAELGRKGEFAVERDLVVVYDDLDFLMGTVRVRERGSSGGHNGIESIIGGLGTQSFIRVRLGIAPSRPVRDGAQYVLSAWKKKDLTVVGEQLERAAEAVHMIVGQGLSKAMNKFNRRETGEE